MLNYPTEYDQKLNGDFAIDSVIEFDSDCETDNSEDSDNESGKIKLCRGFNSFFEYCKSNCVRGNGSVDINDRGEGYDETDA